MYTIRNPIRDFPTNGFLQICCGRPRSLTLSLVFDVEISVPVTDHLNSEIDDELFRLQFNSTIK